MRVSKTRNWEVFHNWHDPSVRSGPRCLQSRIPDRTLGWVGRVQSRGCRLKLEGQERMEKDVWTACQFIHDSVGRFRCHKCLSDQLWQLPFYWGNCWLNWMAQSFFLGLYLGYLFFVFCMSAISHLWIYWVREFIIFDEWPFRWYLWKQN